MSVESPEALERSVLESKDREQLLAIASALGVKANSRTKKGDIIDRILEQVRGEAPAGNGHATDTIDIATVAIESTVVEAAADEGAPDRADAVDGAIVETEADAAETAGAPSPSPDLIEVAFEEPPAEWELAIGTGLDGADATEAGGSTTVVTATAVAPVTVGDGASEAPPVAREEGQGSSRRRRRRNRDRNRGDGPQGADRTEGREQQPRQDEQDVGEPIEVAGYLDLRDEGYGFLRVNGYLPSREDVYVSVKQSRQFGLRKGDYVTGASRAAGRNEKNPALLRIDTVNGLDPELARHRPRFEDLTPLFPDEKLRLENPLDPTNMTARIIDLVSPIGKGQRGLIVSPPKAGKTFIMKTIATSIERNNPEVKLMVLLVDERPEEVTDMRRTVQGEVVASTFDRPSDEHTHVAELAIERARRMVEMGEDVVVILDGITRLARAYNLAAPATGRIMSGGIDAGALYPPKKFFGAARNIEEGGSLTILATALVETNSRMDDAIFEEFKGTGNMELRLDRKLAERRVYPAIDVDASSTRHEELLFDRKQLQMVWKLRRVLSGLAEGGSAAAGLELLIDRLKTFRTNDEFLAEIAKQPSM
jgi:transcription termination factor Rho